VVTGVPFLVAPLHTETPPETEPTALATVIVFEAVPEVARFHQTLAFPVPVLVSNAQAFPPVSLSVQVGLSVVWSRLVAVTIKISSVAVVPGMVIVSEVVGLVEPEAILARWATAIYSVMNLIKTRATNLS
jgi:hypothetical protein